MSALKCTFYTFYISIDLWDVGNVTDAVWLMWLKLMQWKPMDTAIKEEWEEGKRKNSQLVLHVSGEIWETHGNSSISCELSFIQSLQLRFKEDISRLWVTHVFPAVFQVSDNETSRQVMDVWVKWGVGFDLHCSLPLGGDQDDLQSWGLHCDLTPPLPDG